MGRFDLGRQGRLDHDEAVVLAGDLDPPGRQVLDRVVGAAVAEVHLLGARAERQGQHLVPEADAEDRQAGSEQRLEDRHRIAPGRRRVTRAIGQEHAVGPVTQDLLCRGAGRHHGDPAAKRGEWCFGDSRRPWPWPRDQRVSSQT
jgi:hypothetical protein